MQIKNHSYSKQLMEDTASYMYKWYKVVRNVKTNTYTCRNMYTHVEVHVHTCRSTCTKMQKYMHTHVVVHVHTCRSAWTLVLKTQE